MKRSMLMVIALPFLSLQAEGDSAAAEYTSGCQRLFGTAGHSTQILGVEPIGGNALQAILPTHSYQKGILEFGQTIIEYFNPVTSQVTDITLTQGPDNVCEDHGLPGASRLLLQSIHFNGIGFGDRAFGCYLGMMHRDIVTGETRPMIICTDEYTEGVKKGNRLYDRKFVSDICHTRAIKEYGISPKQCVDSINTAVSAMLKNPVLSALSNVHMYRNNSIFH